MRAVVGVMGATMLADRVGDGLKGGGAQTNHPDTGLRRSHVGPVPRDPSLDDDGPSTQRSGSQSRVEPEAVGFWATAATAPLSSGLSAPGMRPALPSVAAVLRRARRVSALQTAVIPDERPQDNDVCFQPALLQWADGARRACAKTLRQLDGVYEAHIARVVGAGIRRRPVLVLAVASTVDAAAVYAALHEALLGVRMDDKPLLWFVTPDSPWLVELRQARCTLPCQAFRRPRRLSLPPLHLKPAV